MMNIAGQRDKYDDTDTNIVAIPNQPGKIVNRYHWNVISEKGQLH